jgi:SulP family sulfate permease
MLAVTATVLVTHDLSKGVVLGVVLSVIFFARKVGKVLTVREVPTGDESVRRYVVSGQIFFVSADLFAAAFEFHGKPRRVEIDLTGAHLWDLTAVGAIDKVVFRYRRQGAEVEVTGLNDAAATLIARVGRHDKTHLPEVAAG